MIGVLALQGAFRKHIEMLDNIGAASLEVRHPEDLGRCSGLIIPGGESTTMRKQIEFALLEDSLREFMQSKPVFGTCAGLILMADACLDIAVKRNGYGRQIESCCCLLEVKLPAKKKKPFPGIFIRAPKIQSIGKGVQVLAEMSGDPVLVQEGFCLGATFHPELTEDKRIHEYFFKLVESFRKSHSCTRSFSL